MTIRDIVPDPGLRSVLELSTLTHEQCITLFDKADSDFAAAPADRSSWDAQAELAKEQKYLNAYLAQLRGANRGAVVRVREAKQATAEARQEVDRLHLHLQNLYYEQRHLRGEITACEAYDHPYRKLPLVPAEEFLVRHPELAEADENELMIARIDEEYAQREALEQARQGLLKKKQSLIADNKKRRDDLANLDRDLEKFIDAAKPIQKTFESNTSQNISGR